MKQAPSNPNVSPLAWEKAWDQYNHYLLEYNVLISLGLSDEQADQYIDDMALIESNLYHLEPLSEEFSIDDHTRQLDEIAEAIQRMKQTLK